MVHDNVLPAVKRALDELGIDRLAAPEKVVMVTDHEVLYGSPRAAMYGAINRKAAKAWKIDRFFDVGRGGHGHVFPMECGMVRRGCSISTMTGIARMPAQSARWAFASASRSRAYWPPAPPGSWCRTHSSSRFAANWLPACMPETWGSISAPWCAAAGLPFDLDYRVLELAGDLDQFSLAARVALCSTPTELGAYGVFIPPSEAVLAHARSVAQAPFKAQFPDADAQYEAEAELDVSKLEPQISLPGGVQQAVNISQVVGQAVQHAFVGSCASSMYEDIAAAAAFLKGRRIADGVRLFVVPGSEQTNKRLAADGLLQVFIEAGAVVLPPGCGPCNDAVVGPLDSGEVSISTATNNNHGRFGAKDARLFLGSPETVAASAVTGRITDPRTF